VLQKSLARVLVQSMDINTVAPVTILTIVHIHRFMAVSLSLFC